MTAGLVCDCLGPGEVLAGMAVVLTLGAVALVAVTWRR